MLFCLSCTEMFAVVEQNTEETLKLNHHKTHSNMNSSSQTGSGGSWTGVLATLISLRETTQYGCDKTFGGTLWASRMCSLRLFSCFTPRFFWVRWVIVGQTALLQQDLNASIHSCKVKRNYYLRNSFAPNPRPCNNYSIHFHIIQHHAATIQFWEHHSSSDHYRFFQQIHEKQCRCFMCFAVLINLLKILECWLCAATMKTICRNHTTQKER